MKSRTNLEVEKNWKDNVRINGNEKRSTRLDVYDKDTNTVYDYKFVKNPGKGLSKRQVEKIKKEGPLGLSNEDIIEINPNSILISLKTFWQKCNCNIDEVNIHQQAISMRMYLFEVISAIQIIQQDLQDYEDENLWNYNGFEDNYNLENMLYSYFFNEKALEYWKNIFSSDTCEKLSDQDIYKLLNWR
ncbi:hypothetical protein [Mediterraneibacter faecis]|uniref:hypothetical protein n=2 Tax=Lachnospiraceae TaxID=186803 RepID=UPI001D0993CC|nr:hypothetical protein [Mediterraneibacter faecis]MCB5889713.1 hypothetical protein [Lachnospiraceae bacterium 210521-DFI.4.71]MCB7115831.1 hypothetical protein [Mediterraneibacter faecis]MCB7119046.1 hypothetical protein [Mediterraneibacter faecis]MCB7291393.1 hypothetical protein [Mediterraneibacter faecis]MCB7424415.1 hypothetical protein [Mediterraneibacter faecis]